MYAPGHGRELRPWLLPIDLATTNASAVAAALMDELRLRRIIAPGPSVIERLVAAVVAAQRPAIRVSLAGHPSCRATQQRLSDWCSDQRPRGSGSAHRLGSWGS